MLDEWVMLRDTTRGITIRDAARRIGTTPAALDKCLERALARGDLRGSRQPLGNESARPKPRYELPISDPFFQWTRAPYAPVCRVACEFCGAPERKRCVTRGGNVLVKSHTARRTAARSRAEVWAA